MKRISLLVAVVITLVVGFSGISVESFAATKTAKETTQSVSQKININTADEAVLSTLPGIGEKTALAITTYRKDNGKFKSIDELTLVKGIGPKKLEKIRPQLQTI